MSDFDRFLSLTAPHENLIMAGSGDVPLHKILGVRPTQATKLWGITADDMVVSPLVAVPIPDYEQGFGETTKRWPGTTPEALRNPLFWLPENLAMRYELETDDGNRMESDNEYALRVALELTAAGLYDDEYGWIDVPLVFGLDIAGNREHYARAKKWLAGADDEILDAVNLDIWFGDDNEESDGTGMLGEALDSVYPLTCASYLILAASLQEFAIELTENPDLTYPRALSLVKAIAKLAIEYLGDLPAGVGAEDTTVAQVVRSEIKAHLNDISKATLEDLVDGPLDTLIEIFDIVADNEHLGRAYNEWADGE